jgi:hypothetical protein
MNTLAVVLSRQKKNNRLKSAEEKQEIQIITPSFCAERLWPAEVEY